MTSGGPKPSGYRVRNRTRSYFAEVLAADPTFIPDKMKVLEYEMSNGREFLAYWMTRGIYGDSRFSEDSPEAPSTGLSLPPLPEGTPPPSGPPPEDLPVMPPEGTPPPP